VMDKSIRRRVIIAVMLQLCQQFTGVNAILSYGPAIFKDAGVTLDPLLCGVLADFAQLIATIVSMLLIDTWGRRVLLLLGGGVMFVSMTFAAVLGKMIYDMGDLVDGDPMKETQVTYGMMLVACVCIYMMGFGPWGIIPWVYPSEIFPMDVKEKSMSASVFVQWAANFMIAFLCPVQVKYLQSWGTLAFYAVCNLLVLAYVAFCVPEIKGIRTEDMEDVFGRRTTSQQEGLADQVMA